MTSADILTFLFTYKSELVGVALLVVQGWLGKTDKVTASNYWDLVVQLSTVIANFFRKKEVPIVTPADPPIAPSK